MVAVLLGVVMIEHCWLSNSVVESNPIYCKLLYCLISILMALVLSHISKSIIHLPNSCGRKVDYSVEIHVEERSGNIWELKCLG